MKDGESKPSAKGTIVFSKGGRCVFEWTGTMVDLGLRKRYSVGLVDGWGGDEEFDTLEAAKGFNDTQPPVRRFRVEFTVSTAKKATDEQIDEWIRYSLGGGSIHTNNPLMREEFSPNNIEIDDTERL